MEKKFDAVVFTQKSKVVTANKYVPHALYVQNKPIVESLGGEILKGVGGFRAEFSKIKDAKEFVSKAITEITVEEYEASRKPKEEKVRKSKKDATPKPAKNQTKAETKSTPKTVRKSKKSAEITPTQQKVIDKLNVSLWNRAAAAYDRANGGTGTVNFNTLGKSKDELNPYIPAGIASLKKSKHWAKAEEVGVTEDMLG